VISLDKNIKYILVFCSSFFLYLQLLHLRNFKLKAPLYTWQIIWMKLITWAGMLLILFFAHAVYAEATITSSVNYYDIYPTSAMDIGREMRERSPVKSDDITCNGNTKWYV